MLYFAAAAAAVQSYFQVYTGPTDVPGGVGRDGDRAGAGVRKKGKYRASRVSR